MDPVATVVVVTLALSFTVKNRAVIDEMMADLNNGTRLALIWFFKGLWIAILVICAAIRLLWELRDPH